MENSSYFNPDCRDKHLNNPDDSFFTIPEKIQVIIHPIKGVIRSNSSLKAKLK